MDLYSGKKPVVSGIPTRKRSGSASKDTTDSRSQEAEFCNRVGCNGRLKYSKNALFGFSGKAKSRPSSSSITSKTTNGGISQLVSRRESSLRHGIDLPQSSKARCRLDDNLLNQAGFQTRTNGASPANVTLAEFKKSNIASHSKCTSFLGRNLAPGSLDAVSTSSRASSTTLLNSGLAIKNNNKGKRTGLRNPQSKSISEIIPGGGLKSESNISRKRFTKDRCPEGESSSSSTSSIERGSSRDVKVEDGPVSRSSGVILPSSRHARNISSNTDGRFTSARSLRSTISQNRMMLSSRDMLSVSSLAQSTGVKSQSPQFDSPVEARVNNISVRNATNMPTTMPFMSMEQGVSHDVQRHNLDGIAEILMSLERIGQGAELTYEQLLSFESNIFLGSFQWFDRHRDMRLDIDNMSYEDLLALEERMGDVSTALPEEALSKCIRRSIYQNPSAHLGFSSCNESEDDVKCSVCQEEFRVGEEIGKLGCEHRYHAGCIEHWLGLKSWCPICKTPAAPSTQTSTSHLKQPQT